MALLKLSSLYTPPKLLIDSNYSTVAPLIFAVRDYIIYIIYIIYRWPIINNINQYRQLLFMWCRIIYFSKTNVYHVENVHINIVWYIVRMMLYWSIIYPYTSYFFFYEHNFFFTVVSRIVFFFFLFSTSCHNKIIKRLFFCRNIISNFKWWKNTFAVLKWINGSDQNLHVLATNVSCERIDGYDDWISDTEMWRVYHGYGFGDDWRGDGIIMTGISRARTDDGQVGCSPLFTRSKHSTERTANIRHHVISFVLLMRQQVHSLPPHRSCSCARHSSSLWDG